MGARIFKVLALLPVIICIGTLQFSGGNGDSNTGCRDSERTALLKFKQAISDPTHRLSSWVGLDCCKWEGVRCSNKTGHVTNLQLRNPSPTDDEYTKPLLGTISPSLLELKHLNYLDLSSNDFDGASIPEFFGLLSRLRYLNLSDAEFGGIIPHQLGNLSKLRYLDLHWIHIPTRRPVVDNLRWLSQLSSLQYLDLSSINLTDANIFNVINELPSLSVVLLSNCDLDSIPSSLPYANFSLLSTLDLSMNGLSSIPNWLFGIKSLEVIDLGYNSLSGPISGFGNLSSLQVLRLGHNNFNGTVPRTIGNLCSLQILDLSHNLIDVDISNFKGGLSGCAINSLQTLDLRSNMLSGKLPDWLGMFRNLTELSLDNNILSGTIPESLGRLSSLRYLYLDNNILSGTIPESLGKLSLLRYLYLASNRLEGYVPEVLGHLSELVVLDLSFNSLGGFISNEHFSNLTRLEALILSSNSLVVNVSSDWVPMFQLRNIHLASCVLGRRFPAWLKTQRTFSTIDISNGSITDSMPDWFWSLSSRIYYLNVSHNQISGRIPVSFSNITIIDLRSNQFHGPLPRIGDGVKYLYLSDNSFSGDLLPVLNKTNSGLSSILLSGNLIDGSIPQSICGMTTLEVLDLSSNLLTGEIPRCSPEVFSSFSAINLANNNLSGDIPRWFGSMNFLESLHLSNNSLHGKIPSLDNCTSLYILDLGENRLEGNIPAWIGESLRSLRMLRLRSNMLNGSIPHQLSLLTDLQVLDLAENNLKGDIPRWLGNLSAMALTNHTIDDLFSAPQSSQRVDYEFFDLTAIYTESLLVAVKGKELKYTNTLSLVINLDLSGNGLTGVIPEELMKLVGLQSLNLAGNHLTGRIPDKIAYLHQLETLDLSRNQLSGAIPSSLSSLTFLSYLNLSYNNLSGRIPTGNQLPTLDASVYVGNSYLCGAPLPNKCPGDNVPQASVPATEDSDESETIWMYIGGIVGFVVGFWSIWGTLLLKKAWRISYFNLIDSISVSVLRR